MRPDLARFLSRIEWEQRRWEIERAVEDVPPDRRPAEPPPAPPVRTVALPVWRSELRANTRTRYTLDPLWRAACEEMNALEAEGAKLPTRAALDRARAILTAAARSTAA